MQRGGRYDRVLKLPYRGAPQTVAVIKDSALDSQRHYEIRELAESIAGSLPSKDYLSEALAIYYFVLANTRYMRDPRTVELVRSPFVTARTLRAGQVPSLDCDDMTALICGLLLATGSQCRIVTVAFKDMFYKGKRQYSHVFAQAREPTTGRWITLDPVAADHTKSMIRRVKAAKMWPVA